MNILKQIKKRKETIAVSNNLTELINAIMPYVITIVTALLGYVSVSIKNKINKKLDTQVKQEVAKLTVEYVQQVYSALMVKKNLIKLWKKHLHYC